jgi:hypothetical protein
MSKITNHNYTYREVRRLVYKHLMVQRRLNPKGYIVDGVQREVVALLLAHLTHQRSPKTKQDEKVMAPQSRGGKKGEMENLRTHGCW